MVSIKFRAMAISGSCHGSPLRGLAGVKQFTSLDWSHVVGTDGYERNRLTTTINKFNLVSSAALVDVYDGPNIAATEFLVRRISVKDNK